jgi:sodium transport system permease protein
MRAPLIKTIFLKELRDILRDRRTLFVMVVLPILLYPLLMIGFTQIAAVQIGKLTLKKSHIAVLGREYAPEFAAILDTASTIEISDTVNWRERIRTNQLEAALEFSPAFSDSVAAHQNAAVNIFYSSSKETSEQAQKRLQKIYEKFHEQIVARRLGELSADTTLLRAYSIHSENIATQEQQQGAMIGRMLGYILIIMTLMGAFYPAIDLTAGEKERGTLETLLVSPASRSEIVFGKFLTVVVISLITASLNVISIGFSMAYILGKVAQGAAPGLASIHVNPLSLLLSFLLIVPLAITFSAGCLAVAVSARNYKEGQSLLTPLYSLVILPAMVSLMPGVDISPTLAAIPIVNVSLLIKEFMIGHYLWTETAIAFASTSILAGLALSWATSQFKQESVLFRHAEDVRWSPFRRRRRVKQLSPFPTPGAAILLVMIEIILLFLLNMQAAEWGIEKLLLVTEIGLILGIPLLLLYRGDYNAERVLSLRPPRPAAWPAAFLVIIGGWMIAVELAALQHQWLPFPDDLLKQFADLFKALDALTIGYAIFLVGILPGICEEILCRGFLLSSFRSRFGNSGAVILAAILFGLLHMNPYRLVPTIWLGLLLGFIVIYTGSIFPAMLAHALNNSLSFLVEKNQDWIGQHLWFNIEETNFLPWQLLLAGILMTIAGLAWLRQQGESLPPVVDTPSQTTSVLVGEEK